MLNKNKLDAQDIKQIKRFKDANCAYYIYGLSTLVIKRESKILDQTTCGFRYRRVIYAPLYVPTALILA